MTAKSISSLWRRHGFNLIAVSFLLAYGITALQLNNCPVCVAVTSLSGKFSKTATKSPGEAGQPALVGEKVPAWNLSDFNGKSFSSADFEGRLVLLNFWATWCPPCRQEIPALAQIQEQRARDGVSVVSIHVTPETSENIRDFSVRHGINFPVLQADEKTMQSFGPVRYLPTTLVVAPDGKIVDSHMGALTSKQLAEIVKKFGPRPNA